MLVSCNIICNDHDIKLTEVKEMLKKKQVDLHIFNFDKSKLREGLI